MFGSNEIKGKRDKSVMEDRQLLIASTKHAGWGFYQRKVTKKHPTFSPTFIPKHETETQTTGKQHTCAFIRSSLSGPYSSVNQEGDMPGQEKDRALTKSHNLYRTAATTDLPRKSGAEISRGGQWPADGNQTQPWGALQLMPLPNASDKTVTDFHLSVLRVYRFPPKCNVTLSPQGEHAPRFSPCGGADFAAGLQRHQDRALLLGTLTMKAGVLLLPLWKLESVSLFTDNQSLLQVAKSSQLQFCETLLRRDACTTVMGLRETWAETADRARGEVSPAPWTPGAVLAVLLWARSCGELERCWDTCSEHPMHWDPLPFRQGFPQHRGSPMVPSSGTISNPSKCGRWSRGVSSNTEDVGPSVLQGQEGAGLAACKVRVFVMVSHCELGVPAGCVTGKRIRVQKIFQPNRNSTGGLLELKEQPVQHHRQPNRTSGIATAAAC
ncbi:hypothetical protein Anapl_02217 [Anas platyrhynchos]|uniref:Uncharacterized protein n=1 Tax=Anas platyrhynchos TaxID=8839 RepID=R0K1Q1_ANAPL|nr:hypothetical protein Anapl_02217 [Anas platyrhynchos]